MSSQKNGENSLRYITTALRLKLLGLSRVGVVDSQYWGYGRVYARPLLKSWMSLRVIPKTHFQLTVRESYDHLSHPGWLAAIQFTR